MQFSINLYNLIQYTRIIIVTGFNDLLRHITEIKARENYFLLRLSPTLTSTICRTKLIVQVNAKFHLINFMYIHTNI